MVDYLEQVLEPIVAPALQGLLGFEASPASEYVEDRAPWHGTRGGLNETNATLEIPLHSRPAVSPDLNPIENVWRIMKQRIKARLEFPGTAEAMRRAIQEEWDRLRPEEWNAYIDSMPEWVKQLKERRGAMTQW